MCALPPFAKWSEILVYQSFRHDICYLVTMVMNKSLTKKELVMNTLMVKTMTIKTLTMIKIWAMSTFTMEGLMMKTSRMANQ